MRALSTLTGKLRAGELELADRLKTSSPPFSGSAQAICAKILSQLWKGNFYTTGLRHFKYLWIRDFGTVVDSLLALGEREQVVATLEHAFLAYEKAGRVFLCVDAEGSAFDFPGPSLDALPWFIHALAASSFPISPARLAFLSQEVARFCSLLDPASGLVRPRSGLAELRDAVRYEQSAYSVTMVGLIARDLQKLGLSVPVILDRDYAAILMRDYWNGDYFNADRGIHAWSSEGNIFPLALGFVGDEAAHRLLDTIQKKKLAQPFALRYTDEPGAFRYFWWGKVLMPNYAGSTIWPWFGALYLELLARYQRPEYAKERAHFEQMVEARGDFPELLNPDGSPYKTYFYRADGGMIWAAIFLELISRS